jgi:hypothetical protein
MNRKRFVKGTIEAVEARPDSETRSSVAVFDVTLISNL